MTRAPTAGAATGMLPTAGSATGMFPTAGASGVAWAMITGCLLSWSGIDFRTKSVVTDHSVLGEQRKTGPVCQ